MDSGNDPSASSLDASSTDASSTGASPADTPSALSALGAVDALRGRLRALEENHAACEEREFLARADAMDELELGVSLPLQGLLSGPHATDDIEDLRRRADNLLARWEALDLSLFRGLRINLRETNDPGATFRCMVDAYLPLSAFEGIPVSRGYDARDAFLTGLLQANPIPAPVHPLEPGMVQLQNTPARILLELIDKAGLGPSDRFYDIGSGLGQVPLVVHILTGARVLGIEREPAYVGYARDRAAAFGLSAVRYQICDARAADYSGATALFLYTPFQGPLLETVLERIRGQCPGARLFTYGPITAQIARQSRLAPLWPPPEDGLGGFARP